MSLLYQGQVRREHEEEKNQTEGLDKKELASELDMFLEDTQIGPGLKNLLKFKNVNSFQEFFEILRIYRKSKEI